MLLLLFFAVVSPLRLLPPVLSGGGLGSGLPQYHFVVPSTTLSLSLQRFVLSPIPFPLLLHLVPPCLVTALSCSHRTDKSSPFCIICLIAPLFCAELSTVAVASHHFLECLLRGPVIGLIDFPRASHRLWAMCLFDLTTLTILNLYTPPPPLTAFLHPIDLPGRAPWQPVIKLFPCDNEVGVYSD